MEEQEGLHGSRGTWAKSQRLNKEGYFEALGRTMTLSE